MRKTLLTWAALASLASGHALAQQGQEFRYLVVWKSRYNDKVYRSEWCYGDPGMADLTADELKQFHAFTDVKVVTVPVTLSPDGVSARIGRGANSPETFAARGSDALAVTDLWNSVVPGAPGAGQDPQVISLRVGDPPPPTDAGTLAPDGATGRPTAPAAGSAAPVQAPTPGAGGGGKLVFDENAPKGQKPTPSPAQRNYPGVNEKAIKGEILSAKSDVLQSERQRLDKERALINGSTARDGKDYKDRLDKYTSDLGDYKKHAAQVEKEVRSHGSRYGAAAGPAPSRESPPKPPSAPPEPLKARVSDDKLIGRKFVMVVKGKRFDTSWRFDADHKAVLILENGREASVGKSTWFIREGRVVITHSNGNQQTYAINLIRGRMYYLE